jgi:DNA helicase HerA-like ATPase
MKLLGICVDQTSPYSLIFISKEPISVGEYVVIDDEVRKLLGIVSSVYSENPYITESIINPEYVQKINNLTNNMIKYKAIVNLLGEITENGLSSLKYPPRPSRNIYKADNEILKKVFKIDDKKFVKIGTLLNNKEIPVYINLEQAIIRHLAILAITGAGKSNTVAVLIEKIAQKNGTALIFDIHGEYKIRSFNIIEPKINPYSLDVDEIAGLIGVDMDTSAQMYYLLSEIIEEIKRRNLSNDEEDTLSKELRKTFLEDLISELDNLKNDKEKIREYGKDTTFRLLNRLKNLKNKFGSLFIDGATELLKRIEEGRINVLDLSGLDEDKADIIISHVLTAILNDRKKESKNKYLKAPIVCILEEAHLFASAHRRTRSKYILNRIAREGRKFGVGLWIISQRPKGLDPDILSQMNNMIILKLVEPEDQAHVRRASESLSEELMKYLPSLNPGEAIIVGNMVRIPILVKIEKSSTKIQGQDPNVIDEWERLRQKPEFSNDI